MHIKIHTKGITGSSTTKKGEIPGAQFAGFLEIDGEIYDRVTDIQVEFGDTFATVKATFIPGGVEVVNHTEETWAKICQETERRDGMAKARRSDGKVIAIYVSPDPKKEDE